MSVLIVNGNSRVTFVPTLTTPSAPKATELTVSAVELSPYLPPDGFAITPDQSWIDTSNLASKIGTQAPGRVNYGSTMLTFLKEVGAVDPAWTAMADGAVGFLVVRDGTDVATAYAATQKVDVYGIAVGRKSKLQRTGNEVLKWQVPISIDGKAVYEDVTCVA